MSRKPVKFEINPLLGGPSLESRVRSGSPYRELQIRDIDVDPDQPRRVFDEEALNELAASIKEHGVLSPIMVRINAGGTFRVIAGERRLRATKLAGLETIPAVIYQGEEQATDTLAKQLVENLQRQDLSSMERALAIGQLRDRHEWSIREISSKLGVSKGAVQRSLEVLALPDDLQAALIAGAPESKILVLAKVESRETRKSLLSRLDSLTREELEREIQDVQPGTKSVYHGGTAGKGKKGGGAVAREDARIVTELQEELSTRVSIIRKAGKAGHGRLVLEFYSDDDLREIYKKLIR